MSQNAFTGRCLLNFGDEGRRVRGQRLPEITALDARLYRLPLPFLAHTCSRRGLRMLVGDNTGQYVWNGFGQFDLW